MSDYMEYAAYYKKAWEEQLGKAKQAQPAEIESLRQKLAVAEEALEVTSDMLRACQMWVSSYGVQHDSEKALEKAREALAKIRGEG